MDLFYEQERRYSWLNYSVGLVSCWRHQRILDLVDAFLIERFNSLTDHIPQITDFWQLTSWTGIKARRHLGLVYSTVMARRLFQNYFCQLYHFIVFFVKFSFFYLVSFAVSFLWVSSWLSAFIEILWYKHILCQLYASLCRLYLHGLQIVGYRPSLRRLKYLL